MQYIFLFEFRLNPGIPRITSEIPLKKILGTKSSSSFSTLKVSAGLFPVRVTLHLTLATLSFLSEFTLRYKIPRKFLFCYPTTGT